MDPVLPTLQSMDTIKKQKTYFKRMLDNHNADIYDRIYFIPMQVLNEESSFEIKVNFKNLDYNEAIKECLNNLKDRILTIHNTSTKFTDGLIPVSYVGPMLFNVENTALLTSPVQYSLKGKFSISATEQKEEKPMTTSDNTFGIENLHFGSPTATDNEYVLVLHTNDFKPCVEILNVPRLMTFNLKYADARDLRGISWKAINLVGITISQFKNNFSDLFSTILRGCLTSGIKEEDFVVVDFYKLKESKEEKESTKDNVGARILETVKNHMRTENLKEDLEKFEFVAKNNITKSELERILELRGSLWGTPIFPNAVKNNAEDKEFDDAFENLRKPAENPTSNKYQKKESNWANSSMRLIEETVIQGLVDLDNKRADYIEGAKAFGINLK